MRLVASLATLATLTACSPDPGGDGKTRDGGEENVQTGDAGADDGPVGKDGGKDGGGDGGGQDTRGQDTGPGLAAGWHDRAEVPMAQQETVALTLDDRIWVLGGFNEVGQEIAWTHVYDPATDTWEQKADFPTPAHHMNAAVYDGDIWVTGFLSGGFGADGRAFVYDPDTDTWDTGPDLPAGRARGSAATVVIDGLIYVAGGVDGGDALAMFDVLDPSTGEWTALADVPRDVDHAAFGVVDGSLIIAGGRNGSIASFADAVNIFDPVAGQWSAGAAMPTARGGVASAVVDGTLYVFGGEGNPEGGSMGVFDDAEAYDVAEDSWRTLDPMPVPRHGLGATAHDGIIYLPGGGTAEFLRATAVHQIYVPETR